MEHQNIVLLNAGEKVATTLDSSWQTLYNRLNNAVRSRQSGMLIEKEVLGWKPPQQPTAEVARTLC